MKKRVHVYYIGMVQGVGFRFTIERIAHSLDVTGWVKNLSDGRVELLSEGKEETITEFIKKISNSPLKNYIQDMEATWSDATGEFKNFDIKFW